MSEQPGSAAPTHGTTAWFDVCAAAPVRVDELDVGGVSISYRQWGDNGAPAVVLIHGGTAHSRWWDAVAPHLSREHQVVALDLSGHGDSGRRPSYGLDSWADEVMAVIDASRLVSRYVLVGHSLGGAVALAAVQRARLAPSSLVLIEAPLTSGPFTDGTARRGPSHKALHLYATADEAIERFRVAPPQQVVPSIAAHLARTSVRFTGEGWTWKFDPEIFRRPLDSDRFIQPVGVHTVMLRGELGLMTPELAKSTIRRLGGNVPLIELPASGHAPMVDQPLALVSALRAVLSLT